MFVFAEESNVASADGSKVAAAAIMVRSLYFNILFETRINKKLHRYTIDN